MNRKLKIFIFTITPVILVAVSLAVYFITRSPKISAGDMPVGAILKKETKQVAQLIKPGENE